MITTSAEKKISIDEPHGSAAATQLRTKTTCARCGGLMVEEVCLDLFNSTSDFECTAQRCVQCGDVVDAVILQNRQFRQAPPSSLSTLATLLPLEAHAA